MASTHAAREDIIIAFRIRTSSWAICCSLRESFFDADISMYGRLCVRAYQRRERVGVGRGGLCRSLPRSTGGVEVGRERAKEIKRDTSVHG